ncbi:PorV/PorQ family protein [candidate division KSB1 bacterium]|nr:PorV/PorQ family protein [candidate division KSB1 bacterium]
MQKTIIACLIILIYLLSSPCIQAGENASSFLDIEVGARAMGMGGAYTALASDGSALYWNPAGVGWSKRPQLFSSVLSQTAGNWSGLDELSSQHYFFSVIVPVSKYGALAVGWKNFSIRDIEIRSDGSDWSSTGNMFDDQENAFYLTYAKSLIENQLAVGISLVYVQQKFTFDAAASADALGINIGMMYHVSDYVTVGIKVDDDMELKWKYGGSDTIPFKSRAGVAVHLFNNSLILSSDAEQRREWPFRLSGGAEYTLRPSLFLASTLVENSAIMLRAGIDNGFTENRYNDANLITSVNPTFGFGLNFNLNQLTLALDYSFGQYRLGNQNRINAAITF